MKKLLLGLVVLGFTSGAIAQEAADKKIQAGLVLGYGMSFQKMGTKLLETNGVGSDLTIGANLNFSFNETIGLTTGVEFDFGTLKYKVASSDRVFYYYNDSEILQQAEVSDNAGAQFFELSSRKQKPVYLTIPTMLLFRTKFIGYFRYFGKFGLRNSFLLSNKINDRGFNYEPETILGNATGVENENMKTSNEMLFFKSAVGLAGGAEWNFSGATSLVAELGYYYGFTQLHVNKGDGKTHLFTHSVLNGTTENNNFSNRATQSQLQFKVSILF